MRPIVLLFLAISGVACGGSEPSARSAESARPEAKGEQQDVQMQTATAGGMAPAPAAPPGPGSTAHRGQRARARVEMDRAERELSVAASDCAAACRALGSMERATGHLCDLGSSPDDSVACEDARSKVRSARDRVRATCGSCPGGPTLDRNAPIPSYDVPSP